MYYGMGGLPGWWILFGGLGMMLFWGVVIGLVVWGIRSISGPKDRLSESERPLEIAQRRYAQGEITVQELEDIKTGLGPEDPREVGYRLRRASRS